MGTLAVLGVGSNLVVCGSLALCPLSPAEPFHTVGCEALSSCRLLPCCAVDTTRACSRGPVAAACWLYLFLFSQIFENKGAMMGCSNPHPHCQVRLPHL